jgi:transposase
MLVDVCAIIATGRRAPVIAQSKDAVETDKRLVAAPLRGGVIISLDNAEHPLASDQLYAWLGARKSSRIQLAVMDMWKPFRLATQAHAPQAAILFDKFHVMRPLGEALDAVRKSEYRRLAGRDRRYIKGQKYTLLSRRENLTLDGKRALKTLLAANKRLNTAYVLKESFGQLWSYEREGWARRFFENWRSSLKWQRLKPYEKFAAMIDRHWDGIAAYCKPENKVSLGFVEGLNNKIRVIQRRIRQQRMLAELGPRRSRAKMWISFWIAPRASQDTACRPSFAWFSSIFRLSDAFCCAPG